MCIRDRWFTAGVVPAVLLGVYLPWSAWVLPVGLGSLAAGFLFKGLKKWPPLRRFLFGAGAILVWLAVYSALFHAPAQDLEPVSYTHLDVYKRQFLRCCTMYFPRIEDLRIDSDRKQYEVAAYLHLNREVYRRYEKGEREIPVWAVIQLARLYGTSTDYILGLSDRR